MKAKKVLICFLIIFSLIIMSVGGIFLIQHLTTKTETNADLGEDKTEQENIEENTAEAKANTLYTLWRRTDEELFTFKAYMNSDYVISVSTSSTGDADSTTCTITVWPGVYFSSFSIDSWSGKVPDSKSANCSKKSYGANTITLTLSASWSWGWLQSNGDFTLTSTITLGIHGSLSSYASLSLSSTSYVYDGSEKKPTPTITYASSSSHAYGSFRMPSSSCSYTNNINAGTATCTVTNPSRYSGTLSATFTISKASNSWATTPSISNWTYGSSASTPQGKATYSGTVTFYYKKSTASSYTTTKPSAAGTYNFYCKDSGDSNHESIESSPITFNINYASNSWSTTPSISSWTYGDTASTPQGQARYSGSVTFYYKTSSASSWTTTKPSTPGTYNFYCYDSGDSNHNSISSKSSPVTFYIYSGSNSWSTAPSISSWTYGDTASTPQGEATYSGSVTFYYKLSSASSWTTTKPSTPGTYNFYCYDSGASYYDSISSSSITFYIYVPNPSLTTQSYEWTGSQIDISSISGNINYDSTYIGSPAGVTGKNVNSYSLVFTTIDTSYKFSNGTQQYTITWYITKRTLTIPTVSGSFTYDNTTKNAVISPTIDTTYITQGGTYSTKNASDTAYSVTFDLKYPNDTQWSDGTNTQKSGTWTIARSQTLTRPYLGDTGRYEYTGSNISPNIVGYQSSQMNLGGTNVEKEPNTGSGKYTVSYTPNSNFTWSDGTTTAVSIDWYIIKKYLDKVAVSGTYIYNGSPKTAILTNFDDSLMTKTGDLTQTNVKTNGNYQITIALKDATHYQWKVNNNSNNLVIEWNITPKDISEFSVEFDQSSFVYDGSSHTPNETVQGDL